MTAGQVEPVGRISSEHQTLAVMRTCVMLCTHALFDQKTLNTSNFPQLLPSTDACVIILAT